MIGFVMFIHALISILLIVAILMQSGRGGGLTEGFASAESIFGAQTNEFMIKTTTVLATIFFVTCIGLAVVSTQRGKSLMPNRVATEAPLSSSDQAAIPAEQETAASGAVEIPSVETPDVAVPAADPIRDAQPGDAPAPTVTPAL